MASITTRVSSGQTNGTGTITASTSSTTVTGSGTLFTSEVVAGKAIFNNSGTYLGTVNTVVSNTSLTLVANSAANATNGAFIIGVPNITVKGLPLSNAEIDTNFINLNSDKLELGDTTAVNTANKVVKRDASGNFAAGTVTVTSLVETSTRKVKENITPIEGALDSILKLDGVTYDRKDKTAVNEAGLIAEDVIKVLPNIVSKDADGNVVGINYTKLTAYLIESVKDLQSQIDELKGNKPKEESKGWKKWLR